MLQSRRNRQLGGSALSAGLGLMLLIICLPASALAQDDSDHENVFSRFERRFWGTITHSLGLRSPDDPVIDYRERSPLVVPPTRDLPPPQAHATPRNPDWPVDPEVRWARERAKAKSGVSAAIARGHELDYGGTNLTPDELNPPGTRGRTANASPAAPGSFSNNTNLLPSQLGYFGGLFSWKSFGFGRTSDEVGTFTGEPPRTDLTAPPPGYQTPSPAQPYGVTNRPEYGPVKPADPAVGGD